MFAVIVYDIPTTEDGLKRRNKIYSLCKKHGYHVQNSVFELTLSYSTLKKLEIQIADIVNPDEDSIRLYKLGKERTNENVILLGKRENIESNDDSFII